jgi:hypothetical protein
LQQRLLAARIARLEKQLEQQQVRLQQQQEREDLVRANAGMVKQRDTALAASQQKANAPAGAAPAKDGK